MELTNLQVTCSSDEMTVLKGSEFRMVADCRAVTQLVEQAAMPIPRQEEVRMLLGGAAAF